MALNAVLCNDGHATYERVTKDGRIPHVLLHAGQRTKFTFRSYRINTVDTLISRFRAFMQLCSGPASQNLAAYSRWHAAQNNAARSYLDALGLLLASRHRANTVC